MDLKKIFIQQQDFFNQGYSKSITFREIQLNKLKKTLKQNEDKILTALEADLGKPFMEGYTSELGMLYTSINYAIKNMHKWSKKEKKSTPFYLFFAKAYIKSTPFGNTLILSAFNYPLLLALDPLVGAIVAGNTAMLGLPKSTPTINQVIIEIINTSFGQEYIYAFETDRYLNDEILSFKFNKIFYTGSSKVGKIVALKAAENLIPITLELGGKSPALVTKNAKINNAADSIVWG
ncbi:MAG: aldehyde dehydrogenase family protein, partial [Erysipelothrix sp.]|nr:aldehyde dehydrogenase family protein [Erysipelothrix sp.]